jgi:ATP-dependent Lhr-like helicase
MRKEDEVFKLLLKPIQDGLLELGFLKPTEPQVKTVPLVLSGENVLLVAPTGSGKTEAILLPIFSRILDQKSRQGISVLYITPLRALNRDMIKRLSYWAAKLGLSIQVRHGDTEPKTRRKQAIHPPDILVTTPETLQAILPGSRMREHLRGVRFVVVDEIHELATDKRGVQLSVAMERLYEIVGRDFQKAGLSATVKDPKEVAQFVVGTDRPAKVVEVSLPKSFTYTVECPTPMDSDYNLAEKLKTGPDATARIRFMLDRVRQHTSTLIFVNSRTNAEMLGHKFNLLTGDVAVHHGSLSREERMRIEDEFKANLLKAVVCTSTMELGVDIGLVDLVIQYLSPRQVGSLIQRVGRSGHRLDLISKGVIVAAFSEDVLESLAAAQRARKGLLEPLRMHENALDVAAHQIAGVLMDRGVATVDEVLRVFNRAYPFRNLSRAKLLEVVEYLHILGEIRVEDGVLMKTRRTRDYYYRNLSMIPDERRYPVVDVLSDRKIGTLGDEFMALRARVGLSFICKGKVWRIVQIEDETGTIHVVPSEDQFAAIPGWDGEMLPVSLELAVEVGKLRQEIAQELRRGEGVESSSEKLARKLGLEESALLESVREIDAHLNENMPIPTNNHVLLEAFDKYIVVHACFGEVVNRTLGSIFDTVLSDHELIVGWWNDGYRILIETPRQLETKILEKATRLLLGLTPEEVDKAFNDYVKARFPFAYKMKFIAERFGALPRGKTMNPDRMAELPSRFKKTPIYEETIREAMVEKVDILTVKRIMKDIREGRIEVSTLLRREKPTPIAYHIFAKYSEVAELMAPDHVILSNIEKMKKTALAKTVKLLCLSCGHAAKEARVRDLPEKLSCEKCGSELLAKLTYRQDSDRVYSLLKRRQKGGGLSPEELEEIIHTRRTADLVLSYGKKAIIALQTKGVGPETAFRILGRMHPNEDDFHTDLLKAKIQYLRTKPFWQEKEKQSSHARDSGF